MLRFRTMTNLHINIGLGFLWILGAGCTSAKEVSEEEPPQDTADIQVCPDGEEELVGYADNDGDGYGWHADRITPCGALPEGYVENDSDCDDSELTGSKSHPGADELCDGIDNDCDFETDEEAIDMSTWYADSDTDGYGDSDETIVACNLPDGFTIWPGDCDPSDGLTYPGAKEICDGKDNDCNDVVDDGEYDPDDEDEDMSPWYSDVDGDGHGDPSSIIFACSMPENASGSASDCDDSNPDVNMFAPEVCDGIDNDCDSEIDEAEECEDLAPVDTGGAEELADSGDPES